jgi:hypothetical protein
MEMEMNNATSAGRNIHCKLTFNSTIRRFVFTGTEFAELRGQVSSLISLPPDGFVLKYVDNESDLITLSTNEELGLALELSDKVLRLIAEPVTAQTGATPSAEFENGPWTHMRGGWGHHGRGGFRGHRGGWGGHPGWRGHPSHHPHHKDHGPYGGPHHPVDPQVQEGGSPGGPPGGHGCPYGGPHGGRGGKWGHHAEKFEEQKMRLTTKIEMMKNLLAQMPPEDQSPSKYKLMAQIHRLEGRLIRWDAWIEKKGKKVDQKRCKKWEKHEKKQEKKLDHLSPEALQQYQLLKAQIASLKPTLYELKSAKKAKKSQLEVVLQQGSGDKETIWQEILVLKERIAEVKKEIKPLKDNIKALKEKK